ncbi:hypothetical protein LDENG_00015950 [Lucifuga dentata]|nr:hypothetical protein LDENG_00015950 [Lucifuga dentata]
MFWFMQGLCFLPVFLVIWSSSTFIISYLIAVFKHDVPVVFPFISDTATNPPESCIFGLMTFISACTGILTIYARYKFVEKLSGETSMVSPHLNKAAFWIGMASCLGMCVVATFQETAVREVHDVGALLFFLSGVLYLILQSVISFHTYPYGSFTTVCYARVMIATIAFLAFFPTVICYFLGKDNAFYLASPVSEWIVAFSFICFFLTYIDDFKLFTLQLKIEFEEY